MSAALEILIDGFSRVEETLTQAISPLTHEQLEARLDPDANSIAWLAWHLTRVQDDHFAALRQAEQVWTSGPWSDLFGLPFEPDDFGYGHTSDQVGQVRSINARDLLGYHHEVAAATQEYLRTLSDSDFPEVIDTRWDPPVTRSVRIVSVLAEDLQHVGQISFIAGVLSRIDV